MSFSKQKYVVLLLMLLFLKISVASSALESIDPSIFYQIVTENDVDTIELKPKYRNDLKSFTNDEILLMKSLSLNGEMPSSLQYYEINSFKKEDVFYRVTIYRLLDWNGDNILNIQLMSYDDNRQPIDLILLNTLYFSEGVFLYNTFQLKENEIVLDQYIVDSNIYRGGGELIGWKDDNNLPQLYARHIYSWSDRGLFIEKKKENFEESIVRYDIDNLSSAWITPYIDSDKNKGFTLKKQYKQRSFNEEELQAISNNYPDLTPLFTSKYYEVLRFYDDKYNFFNKLILYEDNKSDYMSLNILMISYEADGDIIDTLLIGKYHQNELDINFPKFLLKDNVIKVNCYKSSTLMNTDKKLCGKKSYLQSSEGRFSDVKTSYSSNNCCLEN